MPAACVGRVLIMCDLLQTLQEIAAALQYLHRNDVMHGDLTGGNVLLTVSDKDTRGFTAKVRPGAHRMPLLASCCSFLKVRVEGITALRLVAYWCFRWWTLA
jgi:serine/threonine protein kinase